MEIRSKPRTIAFGILLAITLIATPLASASLSPIFSAQGLGALGGVGGSGPRHCTSDGGGGESCTGVNGSCVGSWHTDKNGNTDWYDWTCLNSKSPLVLS